MKTKILYSIYPEIEMMNWNEQLPVKRQQKISWKQQNANMTKIYSWYRNQIWKKSWQGIIMITSNRKCSPTCSKFQCNGSVIEDGKIIANKFNDFLLSMLGHLWLKVPSTIKNPTQYITQNIETIFAINPVSDNDILKQIGDMKDSAAGWN